MALSTNPVDVIRRGLREPPPVPPEVAAGLAELGSLPARYADLERRELAAIDAVLDHGGTWTQIARVLGLGSRQAARQHGERVRARVRQRLADELAAASPARPEGAVSAAGTDAGSAGPPAAPPPGVPRTERRQPRRASRRRRRR